MNKKATIFENMDVEWEGEVITLPVLQEITDGALYVRLDDIPESLQSAFNMWCVLGNPCCIDAKGEEGMCVQSGAIQRFIHEEEQYPHSGKVQVVDGIKPYKLTEDETEALRSEAEQAHLRFIELNKK